MPHSLRRAALAGACLIFCGAAASQPDPVEPSAPPAATSDSDDTPDPSDFVYTMGPPAQTAAPQDMCGIEIRPDEPIAGPQPVPHQTAGAPSDSADASINFAPARGVTGQRGGASSAAVAPFVQRVPPPPISWPAPRPTSWGKLTARLGFDLRGKTTGEVRDRIRRLLGAAGYPSGEEIYRRAGDGFSVELPPEVITAAKQLPASKYRWLWSEAAVSCSGDPITRFVNNLGAAINFSALSAQVLGLGAQPMHARVVVIVVNDDLVISNHEPRSVTQTPGVDRRGLVVIASDSKFWRVASRPSAYMAVYEYVQEGGVRSPFRPADTGLWSFSDHVASLFGAKPAS